MIELPRTKDPLGSLREATGGGADVVLELSGAESSINLGLAAARRGATMSLLGIPRDKAVTIRDYTNDLVFKGLTLHAIIGRRIFETWIKMLDLFRAGLDVEDLVTNEFEGLERFHEAMDSGRPARHESRLLPERETLTPHFRFWISDRAAPVSGIQNHADQPARPDEPGAHRPPDRRVRARGVAPLECRVPLPLTPRARVWKNWDRTEFEPNHYKVVGLAGVCLKEDEQEKAHRTASRALEDVDGILFVVEEPADSIVVRGASGTSEIARRPTLCAEIGAGNARCSTARSPRWRPPFRAIAWRERSVGRE